MNEQTSNFLKALIAVAKFAEPNLVITKTTTMRTETSSGVDMDYRIYGHDSITNDNIVVLSRGYIHENKGQQIEISKNGVTRLFPFFGINWAYLIACAKIESK